MNVLIDTDVLVDLALGRPPHDEPAARLVDALERRRGPYQRTADQGQRS